ncbi:MAG: hypothetical protein GY827_11615 [Cytophagales bacterium]|nr:hypothetical protein [Cytophagales bacterium]
MDSKKVLRSVVICLCFLAGIVFWTKDYHREINEYAYGVQEKLFPSVAIIDTVYHDTTGLNQTKIRQASFEIKE